MRGALTWVGGLGASVAMNGALALVLAAAVAPDPPPPAAKPDEAAFDIVSYPVPQTTAPEAEARGEAAPEGAATGARTTGRAVPQARATPGALPSEPAAAAPVSGTALAPEVPGGAPVQAGVLVAPAAAPVAPLAEGVTASPVAGLALAAVPADTGAPVPADRVTGAPAPAVVPQAPVASAVAARPVAAPVLAPGATEVAPLSPAPDRLAATPAVAAAAPLAAPSAPQIAVVTPVAPVLASLKPPAASVAGRLPPAPVLTSTPPATAPLANTAPTPEVLSAALPATAPLPSTPPAGAVLASTALPPTVPQAGIAPTAPVQSAALPSATALASTVPPAPVLSGAPPPLPPQASTAPPTEVLSADAAPAPAAPQAEPAPIALQQQPTEGAALAQSTPVAPNAPALAPPAQRQAAALAWSGEGAASLDPVSLAAIQAFAEAGDPGGSGPRVRDAIGGLLAQVSCARLQTVFDPASGALELRGHLPDAGLRGPVLAALGAQVGGAIPVADATLILPRPQCGALAQVEAVGLPQSDEQVGDPRVIGDRPFAAQWGFAAGEVLEFQMQAPDYPAYVYVDYFQADGQVFHLQPNDQVPLRLVQPKEAFRTGVRGGDLPNLRFLVGPPFGQEILVAFASSVQLYDTARPLVEPAEAYLAFLQGAVARARAADPSFQGEWYYFFVTTRP